MRTPSLRPLLSALLVTLFAGTGLAAPLKVYILAGQSNMQGHAKVDTIDVIELDPSCKDMLARMRDKDGNYTVCDDVWISYLTGGRGRDGEAAGKLTAGFGARRNPRSSSSARSSSLRTRLMV